MRLGPWTLATLLILFCLVLASGIFYYRSTDLPVHELARYLPSKDAVTVSIDVKSLRAAGLLDALAGSRVAEEQDYRSFVDVTGFDYRTDLDTLLYSSSEGGNIYLLAVGRFDWNAITSYANGQGAMCRYGFCRMRSSQAGKWLSFFPMRSNVMGFAVSQDELGALALQERAEPVAASLFAEPITISLPGRLLKAKPPAVPASLAAWLGLMEGGESARIVVAGRSGDFEIKMQIQCATPTAGAAMAKRLNDGLLELREVSAKAEADGGPNGLPLLLSQGQVKQEDRTVVTTWSVNRGFLESLLSGRI